MIIFKKKNKFNNNNRAKTTDGIRHDSGKEGSRWSFLLLQERLGTIQDLKRQVRFTLIPSQYDENGKLLEREVSYVADFTYIKNDKLVVEDVKGYKTPDYILKRKMMLFLKDIKIKEV